MLDLLGPFLFSICINDLPLCSKIFEMIMYADDTTLYCDIHGVPNIQHLLNAELSKISDWLAANKLSLNVSKTKLMIFHSDKKKVLYPKLFINNSEIERVDSFNFLGLQLNHNLNWTKHINYISLKMSKIIGIIYKLKSVFPTAILRSIYNTLLLPHMSYCILSWGSQIDKIRLLQKKAIRNVTKSAYTAHTEPLHKEYNILKVQDMYQLAILKFYCKLVNNNLPQYFNAFTPKFSVGHINYNLRNPTRQLPTIRHEFPRQSLRYKLIATLNEIPDSVLAIAHNQPQQQFIHIVKDNMFAQYSDTCVMPNCYICKT